MIQQARNDRERFHTELLKQKVGHAVKQAADMCCVLANGFVGHFKKSQAIPSLLGPVFADRGAR